ncbi:uncharacterized protein LACBIDRAFT_330365 [Laccaria bicolor S238N-H82]|uniref:Predicted protein n=1 Tax=Laccaria bicolor (strain S238N-H82 / ATCC MYA-4686) TaxID=486041 RepID=B0DL28_LACBS|nr:uncharacterized protein LACBIDRAFT_330365 [Laccaria bicolor S238N-H82]EDR04753.1 predicted protein [Laccaria bicolor S238N-H82]|eukprot:XP_001884577.1 predicted protein [Laccaria bicolor S238N-H82]
MSFKEKDEGDRRLCETQPSRRIILNPGEISETIDIFYSGTGDTDNLDFSLISQVSIPNPNGADRKGGRARAPLLAFSADVTKFAVGTDDGVLSVWDVRSKTPLRVFEVDVPREVLSLPTSYLHFSSGIIGKEILAFIATNKDYFSTGLKTVHLIDATSFETQETGGNLDLRKNPGPDYPAKKG